MEKKKYILILSHAAANPLEAIVMMKVATNMKAFDDEIELDVFLVGEGVLLAKKGLADTLSRELEGQTVQVGELLKTLIEDFGAKLYVCHAFLPEYGMAKEDLIEGAELKSSSYLGEMLLDGRIPLQISL